MRFNDSRRHNAILAAALLKDNNGYQGTTPRSIRAIWLAMENFSAHTLKKERYGANMADSQQKALQRYARGLVLSNLELKSRLWDYYVYDKIITLEEFSDDIDAFLLTADIFFKEESIFGKMSTLKGTYFGYKKSIWNPSTTVTKYFAEIIPSTTSDSVAYIKEHHINRSRIAKGAKPIPETWSGILMLRRSSIFGLVREDISGTPRAFAFSVPNTTNISDDHQIHLLGDEVESVERSGKCPINTSPILLERMVIEDSNHDWLLECDLFDKNHIKKTHPNVWHHLYGSKK